MVCTNNANQTHQANSSAVFREGRYPWAARLASVVHQTFNSFAHTLLKLHKLTKWPLTAAATAGESRVFQFFVGRLKSWTRASAVTWCQMKQNIWQVTWHDKEWRVQPVRSDKRWYKSDKRKVTDSMKDVIWGLESQRKAETKLGQLKNSKLACYNS